MNIIFFGSGAFAVPILDAVKNAGHRILLVVTQPDRKKGRHLHIALTPVKERATMLGLEIFQPDKVGSEVSVERLRSLKADLFVVVSYGQILPSTVLTLPRLIPLNIHASLLPKYRGAAPIHAALMNGDMSTGITFMVMNERMDQGGILMRSRICISSRDTIESLGVRLAERAARLTPAVLKMIENKRCRTRPQSHTRASYAKRIKKEDGLIQWKRPRREVFNRFRACLGWPGSFTIFRGTHLKVLDLRLGRRWIIRPAGTIVRVSHNFLEVACGRGTVTIHEVLPEAHRRMSIADFLAGHPLKPGDKIG
jgi:methionyl-tRNA formyltransferase